MIAEFLQETIQLLQKLDQAAIARARDLLLDCYRRQGRVFAAGNGGSASTAQHFACDLAKFVIPDGQRPFDVRCLTDNISLYTAWANDAVREDVFVNQLVVESSVPVREQVNATGCGDLLSTCMMLLHKRMEIPISERLRLANRIVAEYIEGKRDFLFINRGV
jgi:hypothetical protein